MRETYSAAEAQALVNLPVKTIYKELELIEATARPRVTFVELVYLRVFRELSAQATIQLEISRAGRLELFQLIRKACRAHLATIQISPLMSFDLRACVAELTQALDGFKAWKRERVLESPDIMGGEPVLRGSRLTVRRLAGLLARGVAIEDLLEDYPYLRREDLANAPRFVQAYPRVGRPRAEVAD